MPEGLRQFGLVVREEGLSFLWSLVYDPITAKIINYFRDPKHGRRRLIVFSSVITCLVLLFFVAAPLSTSAAIPFGKYLLHGIGYILSVINGLIGLLLALIGIVFNGVIYNWDWMQKVTTQGAVVSAWSTVRDIANLSFVLILVGIGFATILGVPSYHVKRLIIPFIVALLLINFSKLICGVVVDFCHILMASFAEAMVAEGRDNYSGAVAQAVGLKSWLTPPWSGGSTTDKGSVHNAPEYFMAMLLAFVFQIVLMFALLILIVFLVARWVGLMVYTIFSPFAYAGMIMPATRGMTKKWWNKFLCYAFSGPVAVFMVWLALFILGDIGKSVQSEPTGGGFWSSLFGGSFNAGSLMALIVAIVILLKATTTAKSMGCALGEGAVRMGQGAWKRSKKGMGRAARSVGTSVAAKTGLTGAYQRVRGGVAGRLGRRAKDSENARRSKLESAAGDLAKGRSDEDNAKAFASGTSTPAEKIAAGMELAKKGKLNEDEGRQLQNLTNRYGSAQSRAALKDTMMKKDLVSATDGDEAEINKAFARKGDILSEQSDDALKHSKMGKAIMNESSKAQRDKLTSKASREAAADGIRAHMMDLGDEATAKDKKKAAASIQELTDSFKGTAAEGNDDLQAQIFADKNGNDLGKIVSGEGVSDAALEKHLMENPDKLRGVISEAPAKGREMRGKLDDRAGALEQQMQAKYDQKIAKLQREVDKVKNRGTGSAAYKTAQANLNRAQKAGTESLTNEDQRFMKQYRRYVSSPVKS